MLVKVIFHGILKTICPDTYTVDANTPAEAIRGVTNQFRDKLIRRDGHRFICSVKECKTDFQLNSCISTEELNIFPAFFASGGNSTKSISWTQIAIGAVIVTAAVFLGPGGFAAAMSAASWGTFSASAALFGASLMLTGIMNLAFSPKIDTSNSQDNPDSSRTFGNPGNTTKIGTRIPIGYGRYKLAGQYLSINTESIDKASGVKTTFKRRHIGEY